MNYCASYCASYCKPFTVVATSQPLCIARNGGLNHHFSTITIFSYSETSMAMPRNDYIFAKKPWSDKELRKISPVCPDNWPQEELIPASGLNFSEYFTESSVPERDLAYFNRFITAIPIPCIPGSVYATFLQSFAEIEQCKDMLVEEDSKLSA